MLHHARRRTQQRRTKQWSRACRGRADGGPPRVRFSQRAARLVCGVEREDKDEQQH